MEHAMFIIKHRDQFYGPFRSFETTSFAAKLEGTPEIIPLLVPRVPDEVRGPLKFQILQDEEYRAHVDSVKVDTKHMLVAIIQDSCFARREERVFTAREIVDMWDNLLLVSRAIESLMHYAEMAISNPSAENLVALRKAFWRNRDSDDVDPHYEDRFW